LKQKSIFLLEAFLNSQLSDTDIQGFIFTIDPIDDYDNHWYFEVDIVDVEEKVTLILCFKVDYLDDSVWLEIADGTWEKVESDRWTSKYFWYRMYCKK